MGIIYLLQPSEFRNTSIYKIGRSSKDDLSRCISYGTNTKYVFIGQCENHIEVEKSIIKVFNQMFTLFQGREYFEGNVDKMNEIVKGMTSTSTIVKEMKETQQFQEVQELEKQQDSSVAETKSDEEIESLETNMNFKYFCHICNYRSIRQSQYDRHLQTNKHKQKSSNQVIEKNTCICGKKYQHASGLSKHKKKCQILDIDENGKEKDKNEEKLYVEFKKFLANNKQFL